MRGVIAIGLGIVLLAGCQMQETASISREEATATAAKKETGSATQEERRQRINNCYEAYGMDPNNLPEKFPEGVDGDDFMHCVINQ
jgi:uncharacterized protein HemX